MMEPDDIALLLVSLVALVLALLGVI